MDAAVFARTRAGNVVIAVVFVGLNGCQSVPWPFAPLAPSTPTPESSAVEPDQPAAQLTDKSQDDTAEKPALPVAGLLDDRWVMNVRPMIPGVDDPKVHWHHLALDATIAANTSRRPEVTSALTNSNPVVAANAAIVIGRSKAGEPVRELASVVRNESLKLPLRLAAIETLGIISSDAAKQAVYEMLETDQELTSESQLTDVPEVHAELLYARSKHVSVLADPRFTTALKNRSSLVRLEAASAWARARTPAIAATPSELLALSSDGDTRVRVAALRAVAVNRHPQAVECLARATRDLDVNVRLAAIAGLGVLGGEEAKRSLDKLRKDPSEVSRAAVIGALTALGAGDEIIAAATDRSSHVRQAVAESLKELESDAKHLKKNTEALARQLVQDTSTEVQHRAVESLRAWPLEQAGPTLLLAMEGTYLTRKQAAAQLAERWAPAKEFLSDAAADRRAEQLARLRKQWKQEFGTFDDQVIQTVATEVLDATGLTREQLQLFERLASSDPRERRTAVTELATQFDGKPLSDLALERLAEIVKNDTDPIVWQTVLAVIASDPRQVAVRLAYIAVANTSSEVRRRACEYLQTHADKRHLEVLFPMLDDPNVTVAIAAVRAIGAAGISDPEPLVPLLNSANKELRLETAIALAHSNIDTGFAAIERLSRETDLEIRRAATVAMGEIGNAVFLPALMLLLEDRRDIQLAAMTSLTKIAGRDIAQGDDGSMLPDEKVRCWKRWYAEERTPDGKQDPKE